LDERSEHDVANAMIMGAKERTNKFLMKLVMVANPANSPEFLEKVNFLRTHEIYDILVL